MNELLGKTIINLKLADYSPRTVESYAYHVKKFLDYFPKNPRAITEDEIKQYFLFLKYKKKLSGSVSINRGFPLRYNKFSGHMRNKVYTKIQLPANAIESSF